MSSADFPTSAESPLGSKTPAALRRAWLTIDQNQSSIDFVASIPGKFAIHLAFVLVLALSQQLSNAALGLISLTIFAVAILPTQRMTIITVSSLFYLFMRPFRIDGWSVLLNEKAAVLPLGLPPLALQVGAVGLFLIISLSFLFWQKNNKESTMAKRPVATLFTTWWLLALMAWSTPSGTLLNAVLWLLTGVWVSCFWYLAYAATDQKTKDATATPYRGALMRPFWGGSATPIGKSYGYLNKFDATDENELAITRLKALKLVVWAAALTALLTVLDWFIYQYLAIPKLQTAIMAFAGGEAHSGAVNWASVVVNYFIDLLIIAIWGHLIVATIRMVGYRIPRNTRNPLAARTLADFWNRYFFYFKELLVDFFFYPAFVRYFKKNTKLRVAFATFCAATLGNFLYHFSREIYVFASLPVGEALQIFHSAVFYSIALGVGLIVSQWRGNVLKPEDGFLRYEILPRLNVFAFFCFLKIFDDLTGEGTTLDRAQFTLSLFTF